MNPNHLLEEKEEAEEKVVAPKQIEVELSKEKKDTCREIVKEINNFGVSERQKLFLIELLSLELENRAAMVLLADACKSAREAMNKSMVDPADLKKKKTLIIK